MLSWFWNKARKQFKVKMLATDDSPSIRGRLAR